MILKKNFSVAKQSGWRKVDRKKFTKEKSWQKYDLVKQKFVPNWFENFLFSKILKSRSIFRYVLDINIWLFSPYFFSAPIAQLVERPTLDLATRVRIPAAQLFSFSFFKFFLTIFLPNVDIGYIFCLVNFFISTFLQALCLVIQKFFFKNSIPLLPFGAKWL